MANKEKHTAVEDRALNKEDLWLVKCSCGYEVILDKARAHSSFQLHLQRHTEKD